MRVKCGGKNKLPNRKSATPVPFWCSVCGDVQEHDKCVTLGAFFVSWQMGRCPAWKMWTYAHLLYQAKEKQLKTRNMPLQACFSSQHVGDVWRRGQYQHRNAMMVGEGSKRHSRSAETPCCVNSSLHLAFRLREGWR